MLPAITLTSVGVETLETVSARELHVYLENRDHFATWIKDRIRVYGFTHHVDFTTYSEVPEKGGRPSLEYAVSLNMAKELAMVERNDKGREARRYFLDCERRAKAAPTIPALPQSFAEALQLAADKQREVEAKDAEIAALKPRSEALATIAEGEGTFCIRDAAKMLQVKEQGLVAYLSGNGWIYRRDPDGPWVMTARRHGQGWMETKLVPVPIGEGRTRNKPQARITSAGLTVLAMRLGKPVPAGLAAPAPLIEHAARPQGGQ